MKPSLYGRLALMGALLLNASACGYIKSLFPDKERDYQFTTEIPELIVPDDLKAKTLPTRQLAAVAEPAQEPLPTPVQQMPKAPAVAEHVEPVAPAKPAAAEAAEPSIGHSVQSSAGSGVSSLQIDQSAKQAWWLVGKALSRQKLEVVERNMDKGYFFVKYDPKAMKLEDKSILDELNFLFGDDPSQEQEYRVSLQALDAQMTEVTVQDEAGKTLSNEAATSLLRLITEGIKQEIPKSPAEKPEGVTDQSAAP